MKKIFISAILAVAATSLNAQTTATNWTAQDCNGTSHTLFNELDNGKVIVFVWVMPCNSCVLGAKAAYNAAQSFATSNPGKVVYYLSDDLGDDNCSALNTWISANNIGNTANMTVFGNSGNTINESDFGGSGMPHVIVMGGTDHKIYYNQRNSAANDQTGIQAAINNAIGALNIAEAKPVFSFGIAPNPAKDVVMVKAQKAITGIIITSVDGRVVKKVDYSNAKTNPSININGVPAGTYVIKATDVDGATGVNKLVVE